MPLVLVAIPAWKLAAWIGAALAAAYLATPPGRKLTENVIKDLGKLNFRRPIDPKFLRPRPEPPKPKPVGLDIVPCKPDTNPPLQTQPQPPTQTQPQPPEKRKRRRKLRCPCCGRDGDQCPKANREYLEKGWIVPLSEAGFYLYNKKPPSAKTSKGKGTGKPRWNDMAEGTEKLLKAIRSGPCADLLPPDSPPLPSFCYVYFIVHPSVSTRSRNIFNDEKRNIPQLQQPLISIAHRVPITAGGCPLAPVNLTVVETDARRDRSPYHAVSRKCAKLEAMLGIVQGNAAVHWRKKLGWAK